ncbi:hypothetical protein SBRCBS47491_008027 [Sporothrix bragantina]|uniref:Zn(2)-C6 fungal-type domain-containing protein n=1 Tax=Sporothrix bragantina TaxID=671064 RepID=A0ABP0CJD5_9PEZI
MSSPPRVRSTRSGGAGRIPSCEPCRTSKLACDHGRPVCARCSRKGTPDLCVYRKDAFKRSTRARRSAPPVSAHATHTAHVSPVSSEYIGVQSPQAQGQAPAPLQLTLYPNPGFQGSSSLDTILDTVEHGAARYEEANRSHEGHEEVGNGSILNGAGQRLSEPAGDARDINGPHNEETSSLHSQSTMLVMSGTAMIEEGAQVLELLTTLYTHGILQQLFEEWMGKGLEIHVGSLLVQPFLDSIGDVLSTITASSAPNWHEGALVLSRRLFHAAKASTDVDGTASVKDFADKYTGPNLRWETVGLVLALAGNAVSKLRAPHAVYRTEQERNTLGRNLLHASNKCASFGEALDILNDVQIIFLYENFLLHSVYFGHQSFRVWGRLNTAINALFGRGIHQRLDRDKDKLPFFLVELRKHVFALLYSSDINFSVFLGRPPRISRRHCVIHMPLDVTPAAYSLSGDIVALQEQELQHLDTQGWNTLGQIRTHAVIRWSMITSQIREEALEAILGPFDVSSDPNRPDHRDQTIRSLRAKIADAWNELPSFLAVAPREVWMARRPGQQTDTLYLVRLYYLQTIFLIEWTASVNGTSNDNLDSLLVAASDLLAWVNEAIIMRERLNRLGLNTLAWRVSAFGLPAAGALAKCLLAGGTTSPSMSTATFTRAIRDLSVLAAHMDYLYDSSDGNDKLFSRAKGILMRVLESTLRKREREHRELVPSSTVLTQDISPSMMPILSPPSNASNTGSNTFDQWEFRPELWIGLPGPNSTEVSHLDFMSDFTQFLD